MNSTLKLSTKLSPSGKTQLAEYFATPPFKVVTLPAYADAWTNGLNAIQMSSSPGLLSGDRIDIQITLAESTALSLNTQAFTRVQAMNEGDFAEQNTFIQLEENSRLFYLPHPLVLHKDSAFKQKTFINMQPNSTLIYGEIVAIGRVANNERFEFRQFSSHLKIQLLQNNGQTKPLVLDCIQWQPEQMKLTSLSQMEDFSHQGSLIYLNLQKTPTEVKQIVQILQQQESEKSLLIGISQLNEVSPEIKQEIEKIELAPSKVTSDLLKITMYDTDEILVPLSELGKKLPYYSKIKPQLTVPSGIDMEVGIYSYSLVDKALDDERVKAKEEEKKKQEEEKKKQAEQGNQDQTTQTTQTTQSR